MSDNRKNKKQARSGKKVSKLTIVLVCVAAVLLIQLLAMLLLMPGRNEEPAETTAPVTEAPTVPPETETIPETEPPVPETTVPEETEPVMLEHMAELYAQNPDIAAWIKIDDTRIDYPVMYTPYEPDKYLYLGFEEKYDISGTLYIDSDCTIDPQSDNIIIYGHNMINGSMFGELQNYAKEDYWRKHPVITYTTLYEEHTYEILAAVKDRVYYKYEDVFKYYQFINAMDEEHFNEAITYFKENALYDTGVTAEYGDHLITLSTCAYHEKNGRFIVVAREVTDEVQENSAETTE